MSISPYLVTQARAIRSGRHVRQKAKIKIAQFRESELERKD